MSFDVSPNVNLTNVQASHKSTDGGGGNTGYFQRGESEEESQALFKKEDIWDEVGKDKDKVHQLVINKNKATLN